jgi:WD40 repeat protein/Flp pilus assembly protein TadD
MDTRQVIARFEAERQALALMEHPNIAHVLDAGATASGRPYFVMELVRGVPVTDFCDQHKLPPRQRLELFATICQAVQHAHQKGLIHRDLKPTNILVTLHDGKPVVKVIDFGIAKALGQQLTDKTLFTGFAQFVGTPLYMSPEQAEMSGLDVDTRSDIYSLGVLLYELLTGTTPFGQERLKQAGYDEIRRIIREEEPPRPSTRLSTLGQAADTVSARRQSDLKRLIQLVRGELDWIVMKALEKDRNSRYATANGLAQDVQRYLRDEPVLACPPSAWYRFRKFARRYKSMLIMALVVTTALVLMVAALAVSSILLWRDNRRAEEALFQTQQARQMQEQARKKVEQSLYFQSIARADLEWWNNNAGRADQILAECPPEHRHWEWRYLKRLCHSELITLGGHSQPVHAVAFDPDGRRLASASFDKSLKIWDLASGKEIRTLLGHSQIVTCVAWSPDGRLLASGSGIWDEARPGELKVWDATTGRELHNLIGFRELVNFIGPKAAIAAVAFSPDSRRLATANWDNTVRLWDLTTGLPVGILRGYPARCIAFSPDGQRLASGCRSGPIVVWQAASGARQHILRGHTSDVYSVAFSPDGQRLVSGSWDHTVRVWDMASGKEVPTSARHTDTIWGVDYSPDGERLASACNDGSVKVWNASTGKELATFRGHSGYVHAVAFSPGGRRLASASWDNTVKIWDLNADQQGRRFSASARFFRSALSPDGKRIAMAFRSPDDPQRLIPLKIHELQTGREVLSLGACRGGFHGAVFSPDGQRVASDWNKMVKIWNAQTGQELLTLAGHTALVTSVAFSVDSQRLASASADKTVKLWDARGGKELLTFAGHSEPVTSVAFSPGGRRLASASKDHTIKIWDTATGRELVTLKGHDAAVTEVAFSRSGERLASASEDRTVRVWDSQTWQRFLTLPGHTGAVTALAFSPDGQRLASASLDSSVRLWNTATGQEALTLRRSFTQVFAVAFTQDGQRLIATGATPGYEGFTVWETLQSNPDAQAAHKADLQNAPYLRGVAHTRQRRWDRAATEYSAAIELGLNHADVWYERGNAYAMLRQFERAAEDLGRAVEARPGDPWLWYYQASAKLNAGDVNGYRQIWVRMRDRFDKTIEPATAGRVLFAYVLIAQKWADSAELARLGQCAGKDPQHFRAWGQALYRAGQYSAAVGRLQEAVRFAPLRGDDLLYLAMAQHQLGKTEEARQTFAHATKWIQEFDRAVASGGWWHWCEEFETKRLRKEAQTLLQSKGSGDNKSGR